MSTALRDSIHRICSKILAKFGLHVVGSIGDPNAINVVAVELGIEKYIVIYRDSQANEAVQWIGRWADDDRLKFNWGHATAMAGKVSGSKS